MRSSSPAKALLLAAALFAAASHAPAAAAQEFSGQIGVASEYVGKGIGKSAGDPSVNGEIEVESNGFYASVFASTAKLSQGADAEIVTSVGWRPEVAGFEFDFSATNKDLPGTRPGVDANYMEYQADVVRDLGPVTARLRVNYSPDGFAASKEAWWIEAQGSMAVGPRTKASAAIADRDSEFGTNYAAWNVGVKHKVTDRVALDVRWYDTDSHSYGEAYEGRLVGALTLSF